MSFSNQTAHYGLPLPTGSDKSTWLDTNTAFQAIDSALYAASQASGSDQQAISDLTNRVSTVESGLATTNANVTTEQTARQSADATLSSRLDTVESTNATQTTNIATNQSNIAQIIADYNALIDDLDWKSVTAHARSVTNLDVEDVEFQLNGIMIQGAFSFGNSSTSSAINIAGTLMTTGGYVYPIWTLTATQMNTYFPTLTALTPEVCGTALMKDGTSTTVEFTNRITLKIVKLSNGSGVIGHTGTGATWSLAANRHFHGLSVCTARTTDETLPDEI